MKQSYSQAQEMVRFLHDPFKLLSISISLFAVFLSVTTSDAQQASQRLKPVPQKVLNLKEHKEFFQSAKPFSSVVDVDGMEASLREQSQAVGFQPDLAVLAKIQREKPDFLRIRLPETSSEAIELHLYRVEIGTADSEIRLSDGSIFKEMQGAFYRGIVNDDYESLVALSFFPNEVYGFVSKAGGTRVILPLARSEKGVTHIFYDDRVFIPSDDVLCSMPSESFSHSANNHTAALNRSSSDKCIKVWWEVDYNIFQDKGSLTNTVNWMNGILNGVYAIYANEDITMQTSVMNVWITPVPYTGSTSSARLASFQSNNGVLAGDLAQYVRLDFIGGVAASLSGLCNADYDLSMCYSSFLSNQNAFPAFNRNVNSATHELGHLLGSRHTHACVWNGNNTPIDNCGPPEDDCFLQGPTPLPGTSTIMSLCITNINFENGFGPQPGAVIRASVENADCLCQDCNDLCSCPVGAGHDVTIHGNAVFNNNRLINGNLFVKSGAELTIDGATVQFTQGHGITVERNARLVIRNNGVVSRACNAPNWRGIRVEGNSSMAQPNIFSPFSLPALNNPSQAGQVVVLSGGTIEWAETGISVGRDMAQGLSGGLVYANGAKFRNNFRDLDFMPYSFPNKSRFIDTDFWSNIDDIDITQGAWIWGTNDIEFRECSFSAYDFEAIRVFDARIRVTERNFFWRNERGISIEATYPSDASAVIGGAQLQENIFWDNKYHIVGQSVGGVQSGLWYALDIINNDFTGGEIGVMVGPNSYYRIGGNRFSGPMAAGNLMLHTGYNSMFFSTSVCNRFENSGTLGALAAGDNHKLNFWQNEFALPGTSSTDLGVSALWFIPGSINVSQGHPQYPADNCFTNPGTKPDIATVGNTQPFQYFYRGGEHADCKHEPLNPGNYLKFQTNPDGQAFPCAEFGGIPLLPPNATEAELQAIRQLLASFGSSAPSQVDSAVWYHQLQQQKAALLQHLVQAALDSADHQQAESLLAGEQNRAADWAIFGLRTSRRDYAGALAWLQQMPATDMFDLQFRNVQLINLAFLQNPASYALAAADSSYLHGIANGSGPVRDYARSLLGLLKGQRFDIEIPGLEAQQQPPAVESRASELDWRVFPNPADETLQLAWHAVPIEAPWRITISDLAGRVIRNEHMDPSVGGHTLQIGSLQNGFYILIISDQQQTIQHRAKFVVRR